MKFVKFNRLNKLHKSAEDQCLICNKKVTSGVVVFDAIGPLVYCEKCIRRLAHAMEST